MKQIRCKQCNKLLAKANYKQLEIKCPRCKFFNNLECHEHRRTNGDTYGKTNKATPTTT